MELPDDLKYSKDHEWVRIEDNIVTIGITDYAQSQLGDVVFAELPDEGEEVKEGETFGAIESVKSVSDCFAPVSGKITEVNNLLQDSPQLINEDCYGEGWMVKIEVEDLAALDELLSNEEYGSFVKEESA
jgi:glycine cleavage system H protein